MFKEEKRLISLILCVAMVLSMMPMMVFAQSTPNADASGWDISYDEPDWDISYDEPTPDADFFIRVEASQTSVRVGDTVDFTIYATGEDIVAMSFELRIPEGMSYVPGSGAVPAGLKSLLGWAATDWTESSMMWTGYNDLPANFPTDTAILAFSCTIEEVGSYQVELFELFPYNGNYDIAHTVFVMDTVTATESCDHSFDKGTVTDPTCTEDGFVIYTCQLCGRQEVAEGAPALGHSYAEGSCIRCGVKDPTVNNDFFIRVEASQTSVRVGDTVDFTIYATGEDIVAMSFELRIPEGMSYVPGSGAVPAGLKSLLGWAATDWTESSMMWTGYNDLPTNFPTDTVILTFSCTVEEIGSYQVEFFELFPYNGNYDIAHTVFVMDTVTATESCDHSFDKGTVTDPTCTEDGFVIYTCQLCGRQEVAEGAPALGHSYTEGSCIRCGVKDPTVKNDFFIRAEASQTSVRVGDTVDFTIYATGEDIVAMSFELRIPEGMSYVENSGAVPSGLRDFLGWAATDWTESSMMWTGYNDLPTNFPTSTVILNFSCTIEEVGSYQVELFELFPYNGNYDIASTTCVVDTVTGVLCTGHDYQETIIAAPDCVTDGSSRFTCSFCGDSYTQVIPATGHSHEAVVTAPTCTAGGYTTHTCHCGDSYIDSETAPLGHNEVLTTIQPTCTQDGSNIYTCSRCGNIRSEVIPATGHSYEAVVTAPTCTAGGYTTHTCHCGDSYIDSETAPLGHNEVLTTIRPTCTQDGTRIFTCGRCGRVRTEAIPATGHSYEAVVTPPTLTEQGYTTHTCSACGDSYRDSFTAPLGMTLVGGFISGTEGELTLELLQDGAVILSITVSGKTGSYEMPSILPGDYTLKVSKGTHTFREYPVTVSANPTTVDVQICLMGDVTGDGRVNVGDVSRLYAHARKSDLLSGYPLQVAELTGNTSVNVGDVSRLYAHARKTNPLF